MFNCLRTHCRLLLPCSSLREFARWNHYRTLGVPQTATLEQIKAKFKELAKKHHPDLCRSADSQPYFTKLQIAYKVLSDTEKRAQYDREMGELVNNNLDYCGLDYIDGEVLLKSCTESQRNFYESAFARCDIKEWVIHPQNSVANITAPSLHMNASAVPDVNSSDPLASSLQNPHEHRIKVHADGIPSPASCSMQNCGFLQSIQYIKLSEYDWPSNMNATCRLVDPKESFGLQSQQFSPFLDLFAQSMYLGCVGFRNCDSGAMYVLRADGTTVAQGVILSKRTTAVLDQYENLVAYICAVPHEIRMFGNVFLWTKRVIVDPLGCYVATCPSVALLKYLWQWTHADDCSTELNLMDGLYASIQGFYRNSFTIERFNSKLPYSLLLLTLGLDTLHSMKRRITTPIDR